MSRKRGETYLNHVELNPKGTQKDLETWKKEVDKKESKKKKVELKKKALRSNYGLLMMRRKWTEEKRAKSLEIEDLGENDNDMQLERRTLCCSF